MLLWCRDSRRSYAAEQDGSHARNVCGHASGAWTGTECRAEDAVSSGGARDVVKQDAQDGESCSGR